MGTDYKTTTANGYTVPILDDRPPMTIGNNVKRIQPRWLWDPYIVDENVNIIGGRPGTGKTWLLCALAAAVTNGQPLGMPGEIRKTGKVLYCGAEDGNENIMRRLDSVGADDSKIGLIEGYFDCTGGDLERYIDELDPALVVFDPLVGFFPDGVSAISMVEARQVIDRLREIAKEKHVSIIAVIHPPKQQYESLLDRFAGSGGFVAASRTATYISYHPTRANCRVGFQAKNNFHDTKPFVYEIDPATGFFWVGEEDLTEKDIIAASKISGGGSSLGYFAIIVRKALKLNPNGINMTAGEILKEYEKVQQHTTNPVAFGQVLNNSLLADLLADEGIVLTIGSKTNGRQKYRIMYEDPQVKII